MLGPAAYAEWFGSQSSVDSAFRDETEMGGAPESSDVDSAFRDEAEMGGAQLPGTSSSASM